MPTTGPAYIFVGFKPTVIDAIQDYLKEPSHPGTMTVPETIAKWKEKTLPGLYAELCVDAAFRRLTGKLESVFAVDKSNKAKPAFYEIAETSARNLSVEFMKWLQQAGHDLRTVCLVGFRIRKFAGLSGVEAGLAGMPVSPDYWRSSFDNPRLIDPYEQLVESDRHKTMPVQSVLRVCQISYPEGWEPNFGDPTTDAILAAKLALKFGMVEGGDPQKFDILDQVTPPKAAV